MLDNTFFECAEIASMSIKSDSDLLTIFNIMSNIDQMGGEYAQCEVLSRIAERLGYKEIRAKREVHTSVSTYTVQTVFYYKADEKYVLAYFQFIFFFLLRRRKNIGVPVVTQQKRI